MAARRRGSASRRRGNWDRPSSGIGRSGAPGSCSGGERTLAASTSSSCRAGKCSMHRSQPSKPTTHALARIVGPSGRTPRSAIASSCASKRYKLFISPLFTGSCRFYPSCADYMSEAVRLHGACQRRLARNPPACALPSAWRPRRRSGPAPVIISWNAGFSSRSFSRSWCCTATRRYFAPPPPAPAKPARSTASQTPAAAAAPADQRIASRIAGADGAAPEPPPSPNRSARVGSTEREITVDTRRCRPCSRTAAAACCTGG